MSTASLLFVINPKSGASDKKNLDATVSEFCNRNDLTFHLYKTTGDQDVSHIKELIEKLKPQIVIAGGGDGTVTLVAELVMDTTIKLAILPLGSANGLATELGIPEDWEENLSLLLHPKTMSMHAIKINDKYLSLHLADLGFNADLIKEFEKEGQRGMLGYAKSFIKKMSQRKSGRFKVQTPESVNRYKADMIVIANASSYGTGAIVNPRCDLEDDLFEVCIFKPLPWHNFLEFTWYSFAGQLENSKYFSIYQTNQVTITSTKPHTLQIDGEVIGSVNKVTARLLPKAVNLVIP
ncbi:YegS/Rv2252/BmrU family lipid kinase [Reichenbachiella agarivorans]|uniref:YegS/Rv2252/BmrU family lipid kinase n=1 Tax=Reichenbachiella agarivorans TaxID=2979464 RepID=A0ABY6CUN3_9BACT|nr:YegS/Rv2252/BmrU family lipid kinase [Reichenbachiella agarivorans]UXP33073.1 YegS/Rv2252/BmrU family lipid kinase [Reichenbachiella agarivorans]